MTVGVQAKSAVQLSPVGWGLEACHTTPASARHKSWTCGSRSVRITCTIVPVLGRERR